MKKLSVFALLLALCLLLSACGIPAGLQNADTKPADTNPADTKPADTKPADTQPADTQPAAQAFSMDAVAAEIDSMQISDFADSAVPTDYVKLTVKDFGQIVVRLRPDVAPISVKNFQSLVLRRYYDGTLFHRVYPGFMIQGGAGSEELSPIKGEFASNGVDNPLLHIRGVLSMARTTVKDSATSQFFLMHADYPSLNGNYAAFGYIVAGLDTVDRICQIELGFNPYNGEQSVPLTDVVIESAVFVTPAN